MPTRRDLLRAGGLALATGLAGCGAPGYQYASMTISLRDAFVSTPPISIDIEATVIVELSGDKGGGLYGVAIALYDADRRLLDTKPLGDFTWRNAPPERRSTDTQPGGIFEKIKTYRAEHVVRETVEAGAVPAWITFHYEQLRFSSGEREKGAAAAQGRIGDGRVELSPGPQLRSTVLNYDGERPPPATVTPADYRTVELSNRWGAHDAPGGGTVLLGETPWTPTPTRSTNGTTGSPTNATETTTNERLPGPTRRRTQRIIDQL